MAQATLWTSALGPSWGGQGSWPEPLSSPVQFQSRAQWVISLKGCSLSVAQTHSTGHTQGTEGERGGRQDSLSGPRQSAAAQHGPLPGNTLKEGPRQVVPMRTAGETVKLWILGLVPGLSMGGV